MAKPPSASPAAGFADEPDGWIDRLLADEDQPERITLWRLGSWGVAAVVALTIGLVAARAPEITDRRDMALAALAEQQRQLQTVNQEGRQESRRLAAAIDTLNKDRDRLFGRMSSLEQGLDSVTGSIQRVAAESARAVPGGDKADQNDKPAGSVKTPIAAAPAAAKVDTIPAEPAGDTRNAPVAAVERPTPPAPVTAKADEDAAAAHEDGAPVARTQFGLDLGGASSMDGLRALWTGMSEHYGKQLAALYPVLAISPNGSGLGLQVHVVAGPVGDAATAARLCAVLLADDRSCETTIFQGQRLTLGPDAAVKKPDEVVKKPPRTRPARRRQASRQAAAAPPPQAPEEKPGLSSLLRLR